MTIYFQEGQLKEARVKVMLRQLHMQTIRTKTKKVDRIGIAYSTCGEIITEFRRKKYRPSHVISEHLPTYIQ